MYFYLFRLSIIQNALNRSVEKKISKYSKIMLAAYFCRNCTVCKSHLLLRHITLHYIRPVWFCHIFFVLIS